MRYCVYCGHEIDDSKPLPYKMMVMVKTKNGECKWRPEKKRLCLKSDEQFQKSLECGELQVGEPKENDRPAVCCLKTECQKQRKQDLGLSCSVKMELEINKEDIEKEKHNRKTRFKQYYKRLGLGGGLQ